MAKFADDKTKMTSNWVNGQPNGSYSLVSECKVMQALVQKKYPHHTDGV